MTVTVVAKADAEIRPVDAEEEMRVAEQGATLDRIAADVAQMRKMCATEPGAKDEAHSG